MEQENAPLQAVGPGRGLGWLTDGWRLFVQAPVQWIVLAVLLLFVMAVCNVLPVVGNLLAPFVGAVSSAMVLVAAHRARYRSSTDLLNEALAGASGGVVRSVVVVAAIQLGLSLIVAIVAVLVVVGISGAGMLSAMAQEDPTLLARGLLGVLPALLIMLCGLAAIAAMCWFAIPDVVFRAAEPWTAMQRSLRACLTNVLPLLVYGIFMMLGFIVSAMTFGLGLLVLLPVLFGSWLASYEDIYGAAPQAS